MEDKKDVVEEKKVELHKKRLSHPDICVTSSSRRSSCQENNVVLPRSKKFSLSASSPAGPAVTANLTRSMNGYDNHDEEEEGEEEDVTKSLETAVRKISRGNSPNPLRSSPNLFNNDLSCLRIGGLSGLARGYEQYRQSLTFLRPMVEFGEASSDDLSSEWESNSDVENNNNSLKMPPMTTTVVPMLPKAAAVAPALSPNSSSRSPPPMRKFPLDLPPISQSKVSQAKTRVRSDRKQRLIHKIEHHAT